MVLPTRFRRFTLCLGSLLAGLAIAMALPQRPAPAAEVLEVQLDGLQLPIDLQALEAWSRDPAHPDTDQAVWLDLLDPEAQQGLLKLLRAPLVRDRSFARELLRSWAGQRLLDGLGDLLQSEQGKAGPLLDQALTSLLQRQSQVTTIQLLRAAASQRLMLNLDGVLQLAGRWRQQLLAQRDGLQALRRLPLTPVSDPWSRLGSSLLAQPPQRISLPVAHRPAPLQLQVRPGSSRTWVLLTPGLGGSVSQLEWLAAGLQQRGWPVLLLDHPGSDEQAMRELLQGDRPPPGAETLADRVRDLQAVLQAMEQGRVPRLGDRVVLMGHSLGGVSSLLAAGLRPEPGLRRRCEQALAGIPLANLSRLLQCQLADVPLPPPAPLAQPVAAVVSLNGFGSLLWPHQGLRPLPAPVLLLGGSLDLITPPLREQLQLFLPQAAAQSRLVLVEGGSHFSPVRITGGGQVLFQLGEELVGVEPERVQALSLSLSAAFLDHLAAGLPPQRRELGGVKAYVLDHALAQRWWQQLQP